MMSLIKSACGRLRGDFIIAYFSNINICVDFADSGNKVCG